MEKASLSDDAKADIIVAGQQKLDNNIDNDDDRSFSGLSQGQACYIQASKANKKIKREGKTVISFVTDALKFFVVPSIGLVHK